MKTLRSLLTLGFVSGIFVAVTGSAFAQSSFTDITVSNDATIGNAINFGQVQLGNNASGGTSHGARLHVTQEAQEVWQSYTIEGYYSDNWVTVEDWGYAEVGGYWSPQYMWGIVSYNEFPAVYDENNNLVTPAYSEPVYGDVYTGDVWVSGTTMWTVVGTHQENQPIWNPETTGSYSEWQYNAPVIHNTATRSDANWVWDVPGDSGVRSVLRVWDGGLALPNANGEVNMTLSPTSLQYVGVGLASNGTSPLNKLAQIYSEGTLHTASAPDLGEEDKAELRPELLRLTRTENNAPAGQTQIAAKSAAFGGVVEVAGDLKVQGTFRVPQRGDISMGEFTNGPQP